MVINSLLFLPVKESQGRQIRHSRIFKPGSAIVLGGNMFPKVALRRLHPITPIHMLGGNKFSIVAEHYCEMFFLIIFIRMPSCTSDTEQDVRVHTRTVQTTCLRDWFDEGFVNSAAVQPSLADKALYLFVYGTSPRALPTQSDRDLG